jgi:hypothetical protein
LASAKGGLIAPGFDHDLLEPSFVLKPMRRKSGAIQYMHPAYFFCGSSNLSPFLNTA